MRYAGMNAITLLNNFYGGDLASSPPLLQTFLQKSKMTFMKVLNKKIKEKSYIPCVDNIDLKIS